MVDGGYTARYIDDTRETWWWNKARKYGVGIGDFVYTVGLFRVLAGAARNMPVVHFGTIARSFDWIEKIPMRLARQDKNYRDGRLFGANAKPTGAKWCASFYSDKQLHGPA